MHDANVQNIVNKARAFVIFFIILLFDK